MESQKLEDMMPEITAGKNFEHGKMSKAPADELINTCLDRKEFKAISLYNQSNCQLFLQDLKFTAAFPGSSKFESSKITEKGNVGDFSNIVSLF